MSGDSVNNNNLCCNPVVLKKINETSKNFFGGPSIAFHCKGVSMGHTQNDKQFSGRNNKNRSSAFRNFLFYQNITCFG